MGNPDPLMKPKLELLLGALHAAHPGEDDATTESHVNTGSAGDPWGRLMLQTVTTGNSVLQMRGGGGERSQLEQHVPERIMRLQCRRIVVGPMCQAERLFCNITGFP